MRIEDEGNEKTNGIPGSKEKGESNKKKIMQDLQSLESLRALFGTFSLFRSSPSSPVMPHPDSHSLLLLSCQLNISLCS
jgi:hypothetical protein